MQNECETLLEPIERYFMLATAGKVKRFFLDFVMNYITNNQRSCRALSNFRSMQPEEFTRFLKAREDFVYEFSSKW